MVDLKLVNKDTEGELLIKGSLDTACAPQVEKLAMEVSDRFQTLTLNLAELSYIASSGLRILRNLQVKMNQKGGRLVIKNTSPAVMEVFEMTGFATFLEFAK